MYFLGSGIVALDAGTGALLWRGPRFTQSQPTSLAVRNGRVFAAEALAFAFDAETGRELWRAPLSASASLSQNTADEHAFYVGTRDHRVHALEVATGTPLWQVDLGPEWPPYESLTKGISFSGDTVYAAVERAYSQNGYLATGIIVALDRSTGRELWRHENGSGSTPRGIIGAPTVAGRLLVASDHRGNAFYAVDRFTGREVWRTATEPGFSGPEAPPVIVGDVVYGSAIDTYVYALDLATGRVLWRTRPAMGGSHYHAVCNNTVFNNLQSLGIVDRHSGRMLGLMFTGNERVTSGFAVHRDRVFFLTTDAVYALKCP
jgi:outer membrane protein assembly factor BamB